MVADAITGFSASTWATSATPFGRTMSFRVHRLAGFDLGQVDFEEFRQVARQAFHFEFVDHVRDHGAGKLDGRIRFLIHEVQRHLGVQLLLRIDALEVHVQNHLLERVVSARRAAAPAATCRPLPGRESTNGTLPSSARAKGRCGRVRPFVRLRRRRHIRCPGSCRELRRRRLAPVPCRLRSKATTFMCSTPN